MYFYQLHFRWCNELIAMQSPSPAKMGTATATIKRQVIPHLEKMVNPGKNTQITPPKVDSSISPLRQSSYQRRSQKNVCIKTGLWNACHNSLAVVTGPRSSCCCHYFGLICAVLVIVLCHGSFWWFFIILLPRLDYCCYFC